MPCRKKFEKSARAIGGDRPSLRQRDSRLRSVSIDQVGVLSEVRLGTRPIAGALLGVSVGATNQPNDGDIGVILGTDVEVIAIRNVSLIVRGSWQGRTIDHAGLGAGGGVGFSW